MKRIYQELELTLNGRVIAKLEGEFTYRPGDPGRYSGPPENCYPAEPPEIELVSIATVFSNLEIDWEAVEEELTEIYQAEIESAYMDEMERRAEGRRTI